jgi:hypothetical protein
MSRSCQDRGRPAPRPVSIAGNSSACVLIIDCTLSGFGATSSPGVHRAGVPRLDGGKPNGPDEEKGDTPVVGPEPTLAQANQMRNAATGRQTSRMAPAKRPPECIHSGPTHTTSMPPAIVATRSRNTWTGQQTARHLPRSDVTPPREWPGWAAGGPSPPTAASEPRLRRDGGSPVLAAVLLRRPVGARCDHWLSRSPSTVRSSVTSTGQAATPGASRTARSVRPSRR